MFLLIDGSVELEFYEIIRAPQASFWQLRGLSTRLSVPVHPLKYRAPFSATKFLLISDILGWFKWRSRKVLKHLGHLTLQGLILQLRHTQKQILRLCCSTRSGCQLCRIISRFCTDFVYLTQIIVFFNLLISFFGSGSVRSGYLRWGIPSILERFCHVLMFLLHFWGQFIPQVLVDQDVEFFDGLDPCIPCRALWWFAGIISVWRLGTR